jgi:hypothetical protein
MMLFAGLAVDTRLLAGKGQGSGSVGPDISWLSPPLLASPVKGAVPRVAHDAIELDVETAK